MGEAEERQEEEEEEEEERNIADDMTTNMSMTLPSSSFRDEGRDPDRIRRNQNRGEGYHNKDVDRDRKVIDSSPFFSENSIMDDSNPTVLWCSEMDTQEFGKEAKQFRERYGEGIEEEEQDDEEEYGNQDDDDIDGKGRERRNGSEQDEGIQEDDIEDEMEAKETVGIGKMKAKHEKIKTEDDEENSSEEKSNEEEKDTDKEDGFTNKRQRGSNVGNIGLRLNKRKNPLHKSLAPFETDGKGITGNLALPIPLKVALPVSLRLSSSPSPSSSLKNLKAKQVAKGEKNSKYLPFYGNPNTISYPLSSSSSSSSSPSSSSYFSPAPSTSLPVSLSGKKRKGRDRDTGQKGEKEKELAMETGIEEKGREEGERRKMDERKGKKRGEGNEEARGNETSHLG